MTKKEIKNINAWKDEAIKNANTPFIEIMNEIIADLTPNYVRDLQYALEIAISSNDTFIIKRAFEVYNAILKAEGKMEALERYKFHTGFKFDYNN